MTNIKLHLNKRFGKLTVIRKSDNKIHNRISVVCICDCGNLKEVTTNSLVRGNVKSCGCIRKLKNNNNKHGLSKSALYICWSNIKSRCKDLSNKDYGGRGIFICKEWNDNFVNFMP